METLIMITLLLLVLLYFTVGLYIVVDIFRNTHKHGRIFKFPSEKEEN